MRGVAHAQRGRFEEARAAFTFAVSEPACDITATPEFWALSRRGMQEAVAAYEGTGRFRDAAALAARIRTTYRPRMLAPLPLPQVPDPGEAVDHRAPGRTGAL
jgi:hypothetical protein